MSASEIPSTGLDRFEAVPLDELVERAELLTRVDRKYLVPVEAAAMLLDELDPATRVLEIGGTRVFDYSSQYFDTADRLSYRLAAQPRRRRFKLRTRVYRDTDTAFLEMKTRGGRGATVKDRIDYDAADADRVTDEALGYVAESLDAIGLDPDLGCALVPAVETRYRRATLLGADAARATVDTGLSWIDASGAVLTLPGYVIVETKSAGSAGAVDRALWRAGHRPRSISKFATGTAALHPELPSNRWARILRGPFAEARRFPGSGETPAETRSTTPNRAEQEATS